MDSKKIEAKVNLAGNQLRQMCPTRNPSEDQIKTATRNAELPVSFEMDTCFTDPVRTAVFLSAYEPVTSGKRVRQLEFTLKWLESLPGVPTLG